MKGVYMKKVVFITILLAILLVFGFIIFPNEKEESNLTKVRVADTTYELIQSVYLKNKIKQNMRFRKSY